MNPITNWLLETNTPQIKYRTMIELLGLPKTDLEVKKAYDDLLGSESLKSVMSKFQDKNKWEHINAFLSLYELGLTRHDVPIDAYVERIIKDLNQSMKCARILLLRNLVSLGYYEHPWVKEQIKVSFSTIREDGTVRCIDKGKKSNDSKLPDMGCYRQTTTYLLLAAELKKIGVSFPEFDAIVGFYRRHSVVFRDDVGEKFIIQDMTRTFFPIDHVNIGLHMILYGLSILGDGEQEYCRRAREILEGYKNHEGKYVLSHSFERPYFEVGAIGEPNKWVTLYAKLIEMYSKTEGPELTFETTEREEDVKFIEKALTLQNRLEAPSSQSKEPVKYNMVLKDHEGNLVGGVITTMYRYSMYVETLWIDEAYRKFGYGSQLMRQAEETARAHGCTMMQLDTFNYQAPEFYKKLGFVQYGELGYKEGFVRHYLMKRLE